MCGRSWRRCSCIIDGGWGTNRMVHVTVKIEKVLRAYSARLPEMPISVPCPPRSPYRNGYDGAGVPECEGWG